MINYTDIPYGKVLSHDIINILCELPYWVVCMIKLHIGEELLLIYFKTLRCTPKNLQKLYISINLGVQIHHGAVESSNTWSFIEDGHKIRLK